MWVRKSIPLPEAMNPRCESRSGQIMREARKVASLAHDQSKEQKSSGQGDGVPKAGLQQAAADTRGSRTSRVCRNLEGRVNTSSRGTCSRRGKVPSVIRTETAERGRWREGKAVLPAKVSGRHVVRRRQPSFLCLPNSQPLSVAERRCARVTSKAGEHGQNSGDGAALTLDETVGARVW